MDPWDDATSLAKQVRDGDVTPIELVDAAIERIEALNPRLNAVIWTRFEQAREEAAGTLPDGPFRGVPTLLKDLHNLARGQPRCEGMRALRGENVVADHDNAVTRRFRQAGFVLLGRTNLPELGTVITTEPLAFGPTRNPWNEAHSTGGSSGGSAAAVASGMVPVAHGSDAGGSIRIPASECGLVGLKPSRGRVSAAPDFGEVWSGVSSNGALARTVRDAARVLDVLAGPEVGDPYAAPPLARALVEEVGAPVGRLRIGILDHPPLAGVAASSETKQAVQSAAALLASLGHDVHDSHPAALAEAEFSDRYVATIAAHVTADVTTWSEVIGRRIDDDELEPFNAAMVAQGRAISAVEHIGNVEWLHRWTRRMLGWWADGWDLLVCPVINGPPPVLGYLTDPAKGSDRMFELMQYSTQYNATGQPALSLPLHVSTDGLPIGVQLIPAAGREDLLVRVGAQLEEAAPWAGRTPVISA